MTHHRDAEHGITRGVKKFILDRLPPLLVKYLNIQYQTMLGYQAAHQSNIYKSNQKKNQYRSILVQLGALDHGNFNRNSICNRTLRRRKAYVARHVSTVQTITHEILDIAGNFAFKYLKNRNRKKYSVVNEKIDNLMLKIHIRDHNIIMREFDHDLTNSVHRTLQAILHGWSVNSLKGFRYSVCLHEGIHICV